MTHLHELKKQYALKQITEAEYKKKEDECIRKLIHLYFREYITLDELKERIG